MKRKVLISLIFLLAFTQTRAQEKRWSLAECIDLALKENTSINQRKLENGLTELTLEQSKAARIPTLSGSGSQGFSFGRSLDPYTNTYQAQNIASNNFGLNSSVSLFTGFRTINTIKKNRLDLEAGNLDLEQTKKDVMLNVTLAYLQVLFGYEQVDNAEFQLESSREQERKTKILVDAGTLPIGNLYSVQSQVANDEYTLVNAKNQLSISRVNLMQLMEIPVSGNFDVVRPDMSGINILDDPLEGPDSIYRVALQVRPDIESADLRVASAETSLRISRGAMYPRLSLNSGISSAYSDARPRSFDDQVWENLNESVRLSLSIPVFNQKQISTGIRRSQINVYSSQLAAQTARNQLRKDIEQAYNDLVSARNQYMAAQNQLISTEKSYNDSNRKYELGMITASDFLIERNNYTNAQSNLITARYNYIFMNKILDFYQGNPIKL